MTYSQCRYSQCGRTITTTYRKSKGVRHRYYVCINRQKNGKQVCDCPILPADTVEHLMQGHMELGESEKLAKILHAIVPEYSHTLVSDCLRNTDILLSRLSHSQLAALFAAYFERIEFDAKEQAFLHTKRSDSPTNQTSPQPA